MDQELDDDENLSSQEEKCFTREVTEVSNKPLSTWRNHAQIFTDSTRIKEKKYRCNLWFGLVKISNANLKKNL